MKKLLYLIVFSVLFLTGCEKNPSETAPESLFLMEGGTTHAGIKVGDSSSDFSKAYKDYTIQVGYEDSDAVLRIADIDEIPFEEEIFTVIANFFIDGKPVSESDICLENSIEPSQLHDLLSSADYLRSHDVLYRYLIFSWENGHIQNISSRELNYNETFEVPRAD